MDQLESMVEERTKELAAANEKVTSVIESITDGLFTLNNKWEFTYVNKHQYFPQRKTAKDVLGKNVWEVFQSSVDTVMYKNFIVQCQSELQFTSKFFLPLMNIGTKLLPTRMMMVFVVFLKT